MNIKLLHEKIISLCKEGVESNIRVGASAGFGMFMGIVPLWGFQMLIAVMCAHFMRLNKPIVLLFSNVSIPLMIPLILFTSIQVGSLVLYQQWMSINISHVNIEFCQNIILQYIVGSLVLATLCGITCFFVCWCILSFIRK